MAKAKQNDNNAKKQKTFRVYLNNGRDFVVKASRFQVTSDDFQVHFYDEENNAIPEMFLSRSEVAAILLEH